MPINFTIVSGGQTGVDRAALDVAQSFGIPCGGWCREGRLAEDGPLPDRYPLRETESEGYSKRTKMNVQDSDGTLLFTRQRPSGGTKLTLQYAQRMGKPFKVVYLGKKNKPMDTASWIRGCNIKQLNVAGPRESMQPGIYAEVYSFLEKVLHILA